MMNRFFTLLLAASCLTAVGQVQGDVNGDGCVHLNDLLDVLVSFGNCHSNDTAWLCGQPLLYQGYEYETIAIGEQCWFAENLRAEQYANGDNIAVASDMQQWFDFADMGMATRYKAFEYVMGATGICSDFSFYDDFDSGAMRSIFGNLYNQAAVDDARQVCPSGWRLPSAFEWNDALEAGAMQLSINGVDQVQWCFGSGGDGTGLNIKPSGRYEGGFMLFQHAGRNAYFWTSTSLEEFNSDWSDSRIVVSRGYWNYSILPSEWIGVLVANNTDGLSVRCIKD